MDWFNLSVSTLHSVDYSEYYKQPHSQAQNERVPSHCGYVHKPHAGGGGASQTLRLTISCMVVGDMGQLPQTRQA